MKPSFFSSLLPRRFIAPPPRPLPNPASRELRAARQRRAAMQVEYDTSVLAAEKQHIDLGLQVVAETLSTGDRELGIMYDLYNYTTADAIDEGNFLTLQRNAWQLWATNGIAHGLIETFVKFIVGQEVRLKALDEDPATQRVIDEWAAGYDLPNGRKTPPGTRIFNEHCRRKLRDTDSLMRWFTNAANGDLHVRFLQGMHIRNDGMHGVNGEFGVLTNPNDIQDVQGYIYWPLRSWQRTDSIVIPGREIIHAKLEADSDAKRGRPLLLPVMADVIEFTKLLNILMKQQQIRTLVAKNLTYRDGAGGRQAIEALQAEKVATRNNTDSKKEKSPRPGSVLRTNAQVEYMTPNMQGQDIEPLVRRYGLRFCVGLGISETVGLGDASQSNYSAGEHAESPMERTFRGAQLDIAPDYVRLGELLLTAKIAAGMIPRQSFKTITKTSPGIAGMSPSITTKKTEAVPRNTKCTVDFPRLKERDVLRETQAVLLQQQGGVISMETCRTDLDRQPDMEKNQIAVEQREHREEMAELADDMGISVEELTLMGAQRTPPKPGNAGGGRYAGAGGNGNGSGNGNRLKATAEYK